MRAIKITSDNFIEVIVIKEPVREDIKIAVGGYTEVVRPAGLYQLLKNIPNQNDLCMVVNEEGFDLGLDINVTASVLYNFNIDFDSCICGDILILCRDFRDDVLEFIGLSEEQERCTLSELKFFDYLQVR